MNSSKRKWLILLNVSLGIFMSTLDAGIVNLALPNIMAGFNIDMVSAQWIVTAYLLTICAFLPIFGRISDMLGKKKLYALGFIVFGFGSLCCGLSGSILFLIISRTIQALGAAILMSNGQGIITAAFSPKERGRALGLTGSVVAIGNLTGPGVGGILVESFGWPSIFFINVPTGILGYFVSMAVLSEDIRFENEDFDIWGAFLFISGISSLFFCISNFQSATYSPLFLYTLLIISIILLGILVAVELKIKYPLIDLSLFKNYIFSLGMLSAFIIFLAMNTTTILMPVYLQEIIKLSPSTAGLVLMIFPVAMAVLAPVSGWISDKIGFGILTTIGLTFFTIGLLLMSTLTVNTSILGIGLRYIFFGLGSALFQSPNNSAVMGSAPRNKLGIAGGLNALVRNLGMISGITLSVSLHSYRMSTLNAVAGSPTYETSYVSSMDYVYIISALTCFMAVILSFIRGKRSAEHGR